MRRVRSARPSAEHLRQGNAWPCPFLPKRSFWTGTWRSTQRKLPLTQPPKMHHNIRTRWRLDLFINLREEWAWIWKMVFSSFPSTIYRMAQGQWCERYEELIPHYVLSGTRRGRTRWASEKLDPERGGIPEPNLSFIPLSLSGYSQRLQEDI